MVATLLNRNWIELKFQKLLYYCLALPQPLLLLIPHFSIFKSFWLNWNVVVFSNYVFFSFSYFSVQSQSLCRSASAFRNNNGSSCCKCISLVLQQIYKGTTKRSDVKVNETRLWERMETKENHSLLYSYFLLHLHSFHLLLCHSWNSPHESGEEWIIWYNKSFRSTAAMFFISIFPLKYWFIILCGDFTFQCFPFELLRSKHFML